MGVFIKSLVINEISGGVVNFGNSTHAGAEQTSKSVQNMESDGEKRTENDTSQGAVLRARLIF